MSIYINGIDMPTKGNPITVLIYPDGTATWEAKNKTGKAVQVNQHGDLIDANELQYRINDVAKFIQENCVASLANVQGRNQLIGFSRYVASAPVVIQKDCVYLK